jgi:hypothetical protein
VDRFCLGTSNFSVEYGLNRKSLNREDVAEILNTAKDAGVTLLDTAISYGESENVIGEYGNREFSVVTKLPSLQGSDLDVAWVIQQITDSIKRLNVESLYAVLLHAPLDLVGPSGSAIQRGLAWLKANGYVDRVGVSIYSPSELDQLDSLIELDVVQGPLNIFDRRIVESGWLERLALRGVEFHARSVFLQGLFFRNEQSLHPYFAKWRKDLNDLQQWCGNSSSAITNESVRHVLGYKEVSKVIFGARSPSQVTAIMEAALSKPQIAPDFLMVKDEELLDPRNWKIGN